MGLRLALIELYDRYQIPLMIVENGLGTADELTDGKVNDDYRITYLREHLSAIADAINIDGVDVFGYTMWAFTDCVSASTGEYKKRYGLVYINRHDDGSGNFERIPKASFDYYRQIIRQGGIEDEIS